MTMRAAEYDRYGPADVLVVRDVPLPPPPARGEVQVRVAAASVNPKDTFVRKGRFRALSGSAFPMRPGYDFAGTVVADGDEAAAANSSSRGSAGAASFPPGTRVWGMLDSFRGGACAEVLNVSKRSVGVAPEALSLVEAAALPLVALTALQSLRDNGKLRQGQSVLIHGASGGVGSAAVQIARSLGAGRVVATCSAERADFVRSLGADMAVDYRSLPGNKLSAAAGAALGAPFDVVLDVFGNASFADAAPLLSRRGVYVTLVPNARNFRDAFVTSIPCLSLLRWGRRARLTVVSTRNGDLAVVKQMVEKRQLTALIDGEFQLESVADAHRHVEGKHTRGKVVVVMPETTAAGAERAVLTSFTSSGGGDDSGGCGGGSGGGVAQQARL